MREMEKMGASNEMRRKLEAERAKLKNKISDTEANLQKTMEDNQGELIDKVTVGMEAMLPRLNQKVIILTMPDNKGEVQVEAGIMKVNVKLKDLRKVKISKEEKKIKKEKQN